MFTCIPFCETMREDWDKLALANGTVFHTTAFRQVLLESFGYTCGYHAIMDNDNKVCALLPLVVGRNLGLKRVGVCLPFVNYTDICANSEAALAFAAASMRDLRAKLGLDYVELRLKDQEPIDAGNVGRYNYTFVLPLAGDEEQILSLSTASNRNHVRKAYKNNWFSVAFSPTYLDDFYAVYCARMKQLGSPAPTKRFFANILNYLPDNASLLVVLDQQTGSVVGGMLLLISHGNATLYYPYGANLVEYNNRYLNNFMYWEAVKFGLRNKLQFLDLGRSPYGSGTYKYKQQWGANAEQLKYAVYNGGKDRSGPPHRDNLQVFVELWKNIPRFLTDPIGEKIIKYLLP